MLKIICPACSFTRDVDEGTLPPAAAIATCPRCKERFRFREPAAANPPDDTALPEQDDTLLPPGAVIPPYRPNQLDEDLLSHTRDRNGSGHPSVSPDEEDERESRRQAAASYRRVAELTSPQEEVPTLSNPWEDPYEGYLAAFYQTAVRVLFAAPRFFAGLVPQKQLGRALAFFLIVGLIQIFVEQFWLAVFAKVLAPRAESDPNFAQLLPLLSHGISLPLVILTRTALITLELFVSAMLYHLMFRMVVKDKANFSLVFQVIAYAAAPALLGIIPLLGSVAGLIWSVACGVVGCRYALRISWMQTLLALGPLYLILMLVFLQAGISAQGM